MNSLDQLSENEFEQRVGRAVAALPDVPAALQQAALQMFEAAARPTVADVAAAAVKAVVRQLQAVLTFDSWATPALAAGMRSSNASTRYLLYSVKGRDIDLRISPESPSFALAGQILGPDEGGVVELVPAGEQGAPAMQARLDDLGEFRIDGVRRGSYLFTLRVGEDEIVLPPIEVGDRWS